MHNHPPKRNASSALRTAPFGTPPPPRPPRMPPPASPADPSRCLSLHETRRPVPAEPPAVQALQSRPTREWPASTDSQKTPRGLPAGNQPSPGSASGSPRPATRHLPARCSPPTTAPPPVRAIAPPPPPRADRRQPLPPASPSRPGPPQPAPRESYPRSAPAKLLTTIDA